MTNNLDKAKDLEFCKTLGFDGPIPNPTALGRPSWDDYFMEIAKLVGTRSTCLRRQVGCVIVKNRRILATGYNGAPAGTRHCGEVGCLRAAEHVPSGQRHEICRGAHAEQNALIQGARYGIPMEDAIAYVTCQPCVICTKLLINAGIKEVIYEGPYPDNMSMELFKEAGVFVHQYEPGKDCTRKNK